MNSLLPIVAPYSSISQAKGTARAIHRHVMQRLKICNKEQTLIVKLAECPKQRSFEFQN